ncbi:MAG: sensor histidine kinase [Actinomycetota bacterium]
MSTTTTPGAVAAKLPRRFTSPGSDPFRFKVLEWAVFVAVTGLMVAFAPSTLAQARSELPNLLAWLPLIVVTDLLPVVLWGTTFALSLPILLAAGMIFPPVAAGILAMLGASDLREIRREISVGHALYNRSQIALSVITASSLFHSLDGNIYSWPSVLLVALLALIADAIVNVSMVALAWHAARRGSVGDAVLSVVGKHPLPFLLSYACFGLAGVLLAATYEVAGNWGLLAFVIPVVLARQAFVLSSRLGEMAEVASEKSRALLVVSEKIADERRDERLAVAAGLHDEVLPPLYRVHLMGEVIRQDLASGRLLALEDDVPDLLKAAESASDATRVLIRDLRHSPLGPGGLSETLRLLVQQLKIECTANIHLEVESVGGSPVVQLLAYQVAREGIRNAIRHAQATNVWVSLQREGRDMRLIIQDDGSGFRQENVKRDEHFGLQLMQERVELAGGIFYVGSEPGQGTQLVARFPAETSEKSR